NKSIVSRSFVVSRGFSTSQQNSAGCRCDWGQPQATEAQRSSRDVGQVTAIALKNRHQVGLKPSLATRAGLAGSYRRIATCQDCFEQFISSNLAPCFCRPDERHAESGGLLGLSHLVLH